MDLDNLIRYAINNDGSLEKLFKLAGKVKEMKEKGFMVRRGQFVKRPDFAAMASPVETHLTDIYHAEDLQEVMDACRDAAEVMACQAQETREASIRNLLLNIMADFYKEDEEEDIAVAPIYGVLWLMEHFRTEGIADMLLELFRLDESFIDFYVRSREETYTLLIARLLKGRLHTLAGFMQEKGLVRDGQQIVADGVIQMAIEDPGMREQVVSWANGVLEYYAQPETMPEPALIDHVACSLQQIKAVECLTLLKRNYDLWRVPMDEVEGGYDGLKDAMGAAGHRLRARFQDVDSFIQHLLNETAWPEDTTPPDGLEEEEDDTLHP